MLTSNARALGRPSARGFTLVELMVVFCLVGMTLVVAAPSIRDWMRSLQLRNVAETVRAGVERARMEALRRNTSMGFWLVTDSSPSLSATCSISATGQSWVVSVDDPSGACQTAPSVSVSPKIVDSWTAGANPGSVVVSATDSQGNAASSVVFNSLGQVMPNGLSTIDITDGSNAVAAMRVMVSTGGSVRLCMPSALAGDPRQC